MKKLFAFGCVIAGVSIILFLDLATLWWWRWNLRSLSGDGFSILVALNAVGVAAIAVVSGLGLIGNRCVCGARMRGQFCTKCGKKAE